MQPIESAVIAAAGLGSRLGLGLPKCMLEIEGRTILSRLIAQLERHVRRVHVVVGYREDLVIDHCSRHHRQVILVRNPNFRTTNTARSMALGAHGFSGKTLFLDGDLLISTGSFDSFMHEAANRDILVGLTRQKSENGICAKTSDTGAPDCATVHEFSRNQSHSLEWANIFSGSPRLLDDAHGFVFDELTKLLPLPGRVLQIAEVDTPGDLEGARRFGRSLGS